MILGVLQHCSITRALSFCRSSIIHQATGAPRSPVFSRLRQPSRSSSHHLRKTQEATLAFKASANKAKRFLSLTTPQRYPEFAITLPTVTWSQVTSAIEWLRKQPIIAHSPELCHPILDRPDEMKKIEEALEKQNKEVKVLYLAGEPGVGKSQLARKYGVNYANKVLSTSTKTVLTLDMSDFRANYCKLAIKLGLGHSVSDGQSLGTVAEEMKKVLSTRSYWLLIIDNYNSTDYEEFGKGRHNMHNITYNHCSQSEQT